MLEDVVKVLISYSWDSEEHKNKVLALSQSLRRHGIDCQIDRYHLSPPEGWYRWMMNQIEESDFVLVVCTEKYNLRYRNKEERGQGRGSVWEGGQIIAELYSGQGINDKFIPILLSAEGENHIPRSLQACTTYRIFSNDDHDLNKPGDYQNLIRHLTKQPAVVPAQLGKPQILLPIIEAPSTVGDQGEIIQDKTLQAFDPDDLTSGHGIDYTHLRNLLKAGKWEAANQETIEQMCEVMGRQKEGWLRVEDIERFPCTDLSTINKLWVKYSNGRFGFSVQKKIWQQDSAPNKGPAAFELFKFGEKVGWKSRRFLGYTDDWKSYNELIFKISAPPGHLPHWAPPDSLSTVREHLSLILGSWHGVSSLVQRLTDCGIQ